MESLTPVFWVIVVLSFVIDIGLIIYTRFTRKYISRYLYVIPALVSMGLSVILSSPAWGVGKIWISIYLFPTLILLFLAVRATYKKRPWGRLFRRRKIPPFWEKNKNLP